MGESISSGHPFESVVFVRVIDFGHSVEMDTVEVMGHPDESTDWEGQSHFSTGIFIVQRSVPPISISGYNGSHIYLFIYNI